MIGSTRQYRPDLRTAKVLMVDDTPANIDVLRKVLKPEGYKLSFASGGNQAVRLAQYAMPDLILLDIMMPDLDGFMVCQQLRNSPSTADIPIIFITAKTDIQDLLKGFHLGAVDYITKPFQHAEVCARVRTHLENRFFLKQQQELVQKISASEQRFRQLATWMPIGVLQLKDTGQVVYCNAPAKALMAQHESEANEQRYWWQTAADYQQEHLKQQWLEHIEIEQEWSCEFDCHPNIKHGYYRLRVMPMPDACDWVAVLEDISAQRQKTQILEQAKNAAEIELKHKADFLAGMTHELRTPMNAIIGYSEMLLDDVLEGQVRNDLQKITEAGRYLLELINNVLDLSKIDAQKMELNLQSFSVIEALDKVYGIIKPLVAKNNNQFDMQLEMKEIFMYSDPIKLQQILFNLLSNACKFTCNGHILLRLQQKNDVGIDWFVFEVQDTGVGLTPQQIEHLFQKYTQVTNPQMHNVGGTGLGLVLSQQFAVLLGGHLSVTSQPAQGTAFQLKLPKNLKQ